MNKMYIVKYYSCNDDITIFVTKKKSTATKYVTKFNRILKKWKTHYKKYESTELGINWIKDEYVEKYFNRWHELQNIQNCFWQEIEVR